MTLVTSNTIQCTDFFNIASDMFCVMDEETVLCDVNSAFVQLLRYHKEKVVGRPLLDLIHPEDRMGFGSKIQKLRETAGAILVHECRVICHDNVFQTVLWHVARIQQGRICAAGQDVTRRKEAAETIREAQRVNQILALEVAERRQTELALRRSEERLRLIIEGVKDYAMFMVSGYGRITSWSSGAQRIFGYSEEEILGQHLCCIYSDQDARTGVCNEELVRARAGQEKRKERWYQCKDGQQIWGSGMLRGLRDDDGNLRGYVKVIQDNTHLKKAEDRQRFMAEASAALASSLDFETTLASVAHLAVPHFADWCSVSIQEADGTIQRVTTAHANPQQAQHYRTCHSEGRSCGTARVIRAGKAELISEVTEQVLRDLYKDDEYFKELMDMQVVTYMAVPLCAHGRVLGAISFASTRAGARYQQEDLAFAEELARRAALAMDNARLYREAQKEIGERKRAESALSNANRRKNEFLNMLAHELRNPLGASLLSAQSMQRANPQNAQVQKSAETVIRQVMKMTRLIDGLLDIARIELGKIDLRRTPLDLRAVVGQAMEACAALIRSRNHEFQVVLPHEPLQIFADEMRVEQIIVNLLTNAIKYTEPGGRVLVEGSCAGGQVKFSIRDSGIGIAPEALARVFDLYQQVDASSPRCSGGLGIGLTLVRRLIELHDGTISVSSEGLGQGSTFTVSFPQHVPAENL